MYTYHYFCWTFLKLWWGLFRLLFWSLVLELLHDNTLTCLYVYKLDKYTFLCYYPAVLQHSLNSFLFNLNLIYCCIWLLYCVIIFINCWDFYSQLNCHLCYTFISATQEHPFYHTKKGYNGKNNSVDVFYCTSVLLMDIEMLAYRQFHFGCQHKRCNLPNDTLPFPHDIEGILDKNSEITDIKILIMLSSCSTFVYA